MGQMLTFTLSATLCRFHGVPSLSLLAFARLLICCVWQYKAMVSHKFSRKEKYPPRTIQMHAGQVFLGQYMKQQAGAERAIQKGSCSPGHRRPPLSPGPEEEQDAKDRGSESRG